MKRNDGRYPRVTSVPEVGDAVYIPTSDDASGGLATVVAVGEWTGRRLFVTTNVIPDSQVAWDYLEPMQEPLRERFGAQHAQSDPTRPGPDVP
jgi:hypothetical protein